MKQNSKPGVSFFKRDVPVWLTIVICSAGVFLFASVRQIIAMMKKPPVLEVVSSPPTQNFKMTQWRLKDYKYTSPLLITDINESSENLNELKSDLTSLVQERKNAGTLSSASI